MKRRIAMGCLMLLGFSLPVAADESWNRFFGLKGNVEDSDLYDFTFLDHPGEGHFDEQGLRFQLFHTAGEVKQGQSGSTANGRIQLGKWDPASYQLSDGELSLYKLFPEGGGQPQEGGVWTLAVSCTLKFTADASGFDGSCGGNAIHGTRRVPPPVAIQDTSTDWQNAHNAARAKVGSRDLQWDAALAKNAKDYALLMADEGTKNNNCQYGHNLYGFKPQFLGFYGENIGASHKTEKTPAAVVADFTAEVVDFDTATCQCKPGTVCGHYTQVISQWSTTVGCGHAACTDDWGTWYFYVCNYFPIGNQRLRAGGPYRKPYASLTCPQ